MHNVEDTHTHTCMYMQWTHGLIFGLMWTAGTNYCRSIAPEGMGATMQVCTRGMRECVHACRSMYIC